jgi:hypothetical protein
MSFNKKNSNLGIWVLLFFILVAFFLVATPGLTLDSFLYFFSQSPMRILGDPITIIGLGFGMILLLLLFLVAGNKGWKM